jgi:NAD(P)-dependent dehydrogenase (short-subunit alcohol dehydrogenase family)
MDRRRVDARPMRADSDIERPAPGSQCALSRSDAMHAKTQQPPGSDAALDPQADHGERSYRGTGKLQDKVAIITGGDSGIGRAIAIAYAREGADIVVSHLEEEDDDAEETCRWVTEAGRRCLRIPGDVSRAEHCREIVERTMDEFGRLDILVNNAGFQMSHDKLEELTEEEWVHTFAVNIHAQFFLVKAALPHLKTGAAIINTASVNADKAPPHLIAYSASKGAIANFTASLGQMLAEKGIRVNCVAPGPIWTPLIPSTFPPEKIESFGKNVPMKRPGQPKEVAPVFVFLASEDASYVTGAMYPVTGGTPML